MKGRTMETRTQQRPPRAEPECRSWRGLGRLVTLGGLILAMVPALAQGAAAKPAAAGARPAAGAPTTVVPDRLLRSWDPVTVFFDRDLGPAGGGPEDDAGRFVRFAPSHPGAFTWLDARTLQFRPAEAWPPLARFAWTVDGRTVSLATLFVPPLRTEPSDRASGIARLDAIKLAFPVPIDPDALRSMLSLEVRPLPGLSSAAARFLEGPDFTLRAVERESRSDAAIYLLELREPVPPGHRVLLHFRLSLDATAPEAGFDLSFATAEPFRVVRAGCRGAMVPVAPEGVRYGAEQPLRCQEDERSVVVEFSGSPADVGPVEARNLVRIEPAVPNFASAVSGQELAVSGDFARETLYKVTLAPAAVRDGAGNALDLRRASELFVFFPRREAWLRWTAGQGIMERFGPQMAPVEGRGNERIDLRIQPIDPLDRSFWPYPDQAIDLDESRRPPGPGEAPAPWTDPTRDAQRADVASRLRMLGSPPVSTLVTLPLRRDGSAARFGVDLAPFFAQLRGARAAGTYLVGMRRLDRSTTRTWMRVQVTDLAVSTLEEESAVVFAVTSLASGQPAAGASIAVEARVNEGSGPARWETVWTGTADAHGLARWEAPGRTPGRQVTVRRLVVRQGDDVLVLDADRAPDAFHDGAWNESRETWLGWTQADLRARAARPESLGHVFTDRPVYRPEETVHIKGYLRTRERGQLRVATPEGRVIVTGPGDLVWRFPAELTAAGSFYQTFAADQLPTGVYTAAFEDAKGARWAQTSFRMEAYRLPRFEVQLNAAERVPLDREFAVGLTASYYAGGRVAARPVQWRVTQFPYTWTPRARPGFLYSSDGRFSRTERFESGGRLEKTDTTDEQGAASLTLNPAVEPTAQPRSYVVEATVTGEDDQTVTATRAVLALPPFVLAVKLPRYVEQAREIAPEILVVGPDGEPLAGRGVTVRLIHRQWHSVLRASDFTDGVARYLTDQVDETLAERKVTSTAEPLRVAFPVADAGEYVVEVEGADRLGRSQIVAADLFNAGPGSVAWAKASAGVFVATPDKPRYAPGETAHVVLQSPFQKATALAVIEAPEGNRYAWLPVERGAATLHVPIAGTFVPRLPVHLFLMRGRLPDSAPQPGSTADLGKPSTVATTVWLDVEPVSNRVAVELVHPASARPGQKVEVEVRLKDEAAKPLAGEVTLWLVDQAVLALGREQRLDPLPDFLRAMVSRFHLRDTRNLAFGFLPFAENPGGESAERDEAGLLDRATVRRTFKAVPYFNPALAVGPDGVARVTVELPDNLTNFKLRAKAASGAERFGVGTSQIAVRLPVIVQPALPRFVRPGDGFLGAAIGRVVEGEGGAGAAKIQASGVVLENAAGGALSKALTWTKNRPERIEFAVQVPTPPYRDDGTLAYDHVRFKVAVARDADGASDAFEAELPVVDDRERLTVRALGEIASGATFALPDAPAAARPGSVRRSLLVSGQPALVKMATGLDALRAYPYGCTEQRVSAARAELALRGLRAALGARGEAAKADAERTERAVRDTLQWIPTTVDRNGLCGYWPGGDGFVWLTAYAAEFLHEAKAAGYPVDEKLLAQLTRALEQALRSDFGRFVDGEAFDERSAALVALAALGKASPAYAAELARQPQFLNLEAAARVARVLGADSPSAPALRQQLWDGIVFRLFQGREVYGGLQETGARNPLVLPSETRALAEATRTLARLGGGDPRFPRLIDGLVALGEGDGWGTTNADAAALLALTEVVKPPFAGAAPHALEVRFGERATPLTLGPEAPSAALDSTSTAPGVVAHTSGAGPVVIRAETSYLPAADGSQEAPAASGLVVTREILHVQPAEAPPVREALAAAGRTVELRVGDLVEDHVQVVNPQDRHFVAVVVPLAAGVEPLNPALATAPPEATPQGRLTRAPTYVMFLDDRVAYFYDTLPKGTYDFYFRTRATTAGSFVQPAARGEAMYDATVRGNSAGARVVVTREGG